MKAMLMKVLIPLLILNINLNAQTVVHLDSVNAIKDLGYLSITNLYSDSNATEDVVWIKTEVKPHIHSHHTEFAYILKGTGKMLLGDSTFIVSQGDLIFIPAGIVHALQVTSDTPVKVLTVHAPRYDGKDRVEVNMKW